MRPAAGLTALVLLSTAPAIAQSWKEYAYPDAGFSVQFPGSPVRNEEAYHAEAHDGAKISIPAIVYSLQQGHTTYRATVVDLRNTPADVPDAVDRAAQTLGAGGDIKSDAVVSIANGQCGRHLVVEGKDRSLSTIAVFLPKTSHRLYLLQATVPQEDLAAAGGDALRFQQSLQFPETPAIAAAPDGWNEFQYTDSGFASRWPVAPNVTRGFYTTADGVTVPATYYAASQVQVRYEATVAELWHTSADRVDAIDKAVSLLGFDARVTADDIVSVANGQCGHHLTLVDKDGRRSNAAVFFPTSSHRLYVLRATMLSGDAETEIQDAARFRDSLRVLRDPTEP